MTKIPTPFIGGSNGPLRPSEDDQKLEPPFVPLDAPKVAAEPEPEPPPSEAAARGDAPIRVPVEEVEPAETPEPSEPAEPQGEAASGLVSDGLEDDVQASETAAAAELASEVARATQEAERAAGAGLDLPDFLLSADTPAPEATDAAAEREAEVPPEGAESAATIAETAEELRRGRLGPWIVSLSQELGVHGVEVAVRRAFAAGYLAGKREKE